MNTIFNITSEAEFLHHCLETFRYQYENIEIYGKFCDYLKRNPGNVSSLEAIPFLPIEMFKNHIVLDKNYTTELYFQSSGTTQMTRSKHYIADAHLYEQSIEASFQQFIGDPQDFVFLGLLPSYSENQHSSLIYMVDFLMRKSGEKENDYFLYNHQELYDLLQHIGSKKVIVFGVSFALLDFLDFCKTKELSFNASEELIIIETGGMKGRKEEMTKDALLNILQNGFKTTKIYSEYSMTELLSQAYSLGENIYEAPNWMRILIRNLEDPFSYAEPGKTGAVNIIDLANRYSCSFIATQDLGKSLKTNAGVLELNSPQFQILGRIDHSDIRGCSLLVS